MMINGYINRQTTTGQGMDATPEPKTEAEYQMWLQEVANPAPYLGPVCRLGNFFPNLPAGRGYAKPNAFESHDEYMSRVVRKIQLREAN